MLGYQILSLIGVFLLFISIFMLKKEVDKKEVSTTKVMYLSLLLIISAILASLGTNNGSIMLIPYDCTMIFGQELSSECTERIKFLKKINLI
jgi:uncharacterized membrane protein